MGLAGTGTHHLELNDVFVPDRRYITRHGRGMNFQDAPGPISIARQHPFGPYSLVSVVVGTAGGFIDRFVEEMKGRASRFGSNIAEFQSLQLRIAESAAEFEAARLVVLGNLRETMDYLHRGEPPPPPIELRNRRDMGFAAQLAVAGRRPTVLRRRRQFPVQVQRHGAAVPRCPCRQPSAGYELG